MKKLRHIKLFENFDLHEDLNSSISDSLNILDRSGSVFSYKDGGSIEDFDSYQDKSDAEYLLGMLISQYLGVNPKEVVGISGDSLNSGESGISYDELTDYLKDLVNDIEKGKKIGEIEKDDPRIGPYLEYPFGVYETREGIFISGAYGGGNIVYFSQDTLKKLIK